MSEADLQRVEQILYEDQPTQLFHTSVGVQQDFVSIFTDLVLGQSNLHLQVGSRKDRGEKVKMHGPRQEKHLSN